MNPNLIELQNYSLPNQDNLRIATLYPVIPRKTDAVQFDIYDYEMLFNDKKTVDLIRKGNTIGCFYIESPAMRSLLKRLDVETFEMLTAASSVIRPGVAESGMMQEFIARHHNPSRRKYLVPRYGNLSRRNLRRYDLPGRCNKSCSSYCGTFFGRSRFTPQSNVGKDAFPQSDGSINKKIF